MVRNTLSLSAVAKQNRDRGQNQKLDACGLPRQNRISTTTTRLGVRIRVWKASHQQESFLSLHFFAVALGIGSISFLSFFSFGSCCLQIVCCAGDSAVFWLAVCRGARELGFRWHACIPRLALGDRYSFTVASGHRLTCWWGL